MRRLAIFDIDGTLTDTNDVDDECFRKAMAETFQVGAADFDWNEAPHITDSAIAQWVCESRYGRLPTASELALAVERFVDLLQSEVTARPERFQPIPGAAAALDALRARGWHVAMATGGWEASARLKLTAAALQTEDIPLASASDHVSRAEIVRTAQTRAEELTGETYSRVVSIGDGTWDVHCAQMLGVPFIGVAKGSRAEALRRAHATIVIPDFLDMAAFCAAVGSTDTTSPAD